MRRLESAVAIAIVLTSLGTLFPRLKGWMAVFPLIITVATLGVQAFEEVDASWLVFYQCKYFLELVYHQH